MMMTTDSNVPPLMTMSNNINTQMQDQCHPWEWETMTMMISQNTHLLPPQYTSNAAHDRLAFGARAFGLNLGWQAYFSAEDAASLRLHFWQQKPKQPPQCKADGCSADLSGAKHYHRRHKVCERHAKAAIAVYKGLQQRFCQQCSRFHGLAEFDGAKRSCRRRLADHNRRRRKVLFREADKAESKPTGPTPKANKILPTTKYTTTTVSTICSAGTRLEGQGHQNTASHMTNEPVLLVGRVGSEDTKEEASQEQQQQQILNHFPSDTFFHHHHLLFPNSNMGAQPSSGEGFQMTNHYQNQLNGSLPHLSQAMLDWEFI